MNSVYALLFFVLIQANLFACNIIRDYFIYNNQIINEINIFNKPDSCTKDIYISFINPEMQTEIFGFLSNNKEITTSTAEAIECSSTIRDFISTQTMIISQERNTVIAEDFNDIILPNAILKITKNLLSDSIAPKIASSTLPDGFIPECAQKILNRIKSKILESSWHEKLLAFLLRFFDDANDFIYLGVILILVCVILYLLCKTTMKNSFIKLKLKRKEKTITFD